MHIIGNQHAQKDEINVRTFFDNNQRLTSWAVVVPKGPGLSKVVTFLRDNKMLKKGRNVLSLSDGSPLLKAINDFEKNPTESNLPSSDTNLMVIFGADSVTSEKISMSWKTILDDIESRTESEGKALSYVYIVTDVRVNNVEGGNEVGGKRGREEGRDCQDSNAALKTAGMVILSRLRAEAMSKIKNTNQDAWSKEAIENERRKGKSKFTFCELFAGIGGFRFGLEPLGGECLFTSEIAAEAWKGYCYNHGIQWTDNSETGKRKEYLVGDISELSDDNIRYLRSTEELSTMPAADLKEGEIDCLTGGFPCQPFSKAGHQKALNDPRGLLFLEILRVLRLQKPRIFILENVANLVDIEEGAVMEIILDSLRAGKARPVNDILGGKTTNQQVEGGEAYHVIHKVVDASILVPQQRNRVYFLGVNVAWLTSIEKNPADKEKVSMLKSYFGVDGKKETYPWPAPTQPLPSLTNVFAPAEDSFDEHTLSDTQLQALRKSRNRRFVTRELSSLLDRSTCENGNKEWLKQLQFPEIFPSVDSNSPMPDPKEFERLFSTGATTNGAESGNEKAHARQGTSCSLLVPREGQEKEKCLRCVARTLMSSYRHGYTKYSEFVVEISQDGALSVRFYTPEECARIMGFMPLLHETNQKVEEGGEKERISFDPTAGGSIPIGATYRLLGNAVVPPVISAVAKALVEATFGL